MACARVMSDEYSKLLRPYQAESRRSWKDLKKDHAESGRDIITPCPYMQEIKEAKIRRQDATRKRKVCKNKRGFSAREPINGVQCTLWLPRGEPRGTLLFLHGRGQCGDDNEMNLTVGLPEWLEKAPERWPLAVVIPQKPDPDEDWSAYQRQVLRHLDSCIADADLDPQRVAITGLSQGGHGTLHIAANRPHRFRAVAAICAFPTYNDEGQLKEVTKKEVAGETARLADCLTSLPVRLYHGEIDGIVPADRSREMQAALKKRGGNVGLRVYKNTGHNAWKKAYGESDLADWLVDHLSST